MEIGGKHKERILKIIKKEGVSTKNIIFEKITLIDYE